MRRKLATRAVHLHALSDVTVANCEFYTPCSRSRNSCLVWPCGLGGCPLISGHHRQKSKVEPSTLRVCHRWKPTAQIRLFSQFDSCSRFGQSLPSGAKSGSICPYRSSLNVLQRLISGTAIRTLGHVSEPLLQILTLPCQLKTSLRRNHDGLPFLRRPSPAIPAAQTFPFVSITATIGQPSLSRTPKAPRGDPFSSTITNFSARISFGNGAAPVRGRLCLPRAAR